MFSVGHMDTTEGARLEPVPHEACLLCGRDHHIENLRILYILVSEGKEAWGGLVSSSQSSSSGNPQHI